MDAADPKPDSIVFIESLSDIAPAQLEGFFVGWPEAPSPETLLTILENSTHRVLAYDGVEQRVVGFVNCISDGVLAGYIPLLEVLPHYQHKGIGRRLVERMLELTSRYYMIDLSCDAGLVPFYEKLGLKRGIVMRRRNYERQRGV